MCELTETNLGLEIEKFLQSLAVSAPERERYYRNVLAHNELVSVMSDYVFKTLFNASVNNKRLSKLLSLLLTFKVEVVGDLNTENAPKTKNSKRSTFDILAKLESG
jgi:hypothetical protein